MDAKLYTADMEASIEEGKRLGREEERAKLNITLRGGATVSGEYPNLIVTGLYFGELSEQAREEGRREVLKEIAALPLQGDVCPTCRRHVILEQSHWHAADCLWLRAQAVKA